MPSVVIIHAAEDTLPARALAEKIRKAKVQVVLEKPPGRELRDAVAGAKITVALWSPRAINSIELVEEVKFARGKNGVLHALMQNAQAPSVFRGDKAIDLTGWRGEDEFGPWRALANLITARAGVAPLPENVAPSSGFFKKETVDSTSLPLRHWRPIEEIAPPSLESRQSERRPALPEQNAIFIGYRRDDTADVAGRMFDHLETKFGANAVFKDVDSIPPGTRFREYIPSVIERCSVFLSLIGPTWNVADDAGHRRIDDNNDFVRIEIEAALASWRVRLMPVLVNGAPMPRKHQLPEALHPLADFNAAVVRRDPDFRSDMSRLCKVIETALRDIEHT